MKKNGLYYIAVTKGGKGGRYREALILSNVETIVKQMEKAGDKKVYGIRTRDILAVSLLRKVHSTKPREE